MLRRPARRLSPNERNDQHHDKTVCLPPCVKVGDEAAHRRIGRQKSVLSQVLIYVLLTGVSFTFLYPIFCFLSASGMDAYDLVDPLVNWLPCSFNTDNFVKAYNALGAIRPRSPPCSGWGSSPWCRPWFPPWWLTASRSTTSLSAGYSSR